jgi:hypothetical protein
VKDVADCFDFRVMVSSGGLQSHFSQLPLSVVFPAPQLAIIKLGVAKRMETAADSLFDVQDFKDVS